MALLVQLETLCGAFTSLEEEQSAEVLARFLHATLPLQAYNSSLAKSPTDRITWQAPVTFDETQRYSVQKTLRKLIKRSQRSDTFALPDVIDDRGWWGERLVRQGYPNGFGEREAARWLL